MKTFSWVLGAALAAGLGMTVALAQNTPPAGGGGDAGGAGGGGGGRAGNRAGGNRAGGGGGGGMMMPGMQSPAEEMFNTIATLTDEQKKVIQAKSDALQQALADQMTDMFDKMNAARDSMGDPDARAAFTAQMQKMQDQRMALVAKGNAEMEAVLTPEQKIVWETHNLTQQADGRLRGVQLTDDQKTKVAAAVKDTATALAATADAKEKAALTGKFWKKLVAEILTDDQTSKLLGQGGFGGFGGMMFGPPPGFGGGGFGGPGGGPPGGGPGGLGGPGGGGGGPGGGPGGPPPDGPGGPPAN